MGNFYRFYYTFRIYSLLFVGIYIKLDTSKGVVLYQSKQCGHCAKGVACNIVNGICHTGCESGYKETLQCNAHKYGLDRLKSCNDEISSRKKSNLRADSFTAPQLFNFRKYVICCSSALFMRLYLRLCGLICSSSLLPAVLREVCDS